MFSGTDIKDAVIPVARNMPSGEMFQPEVFAKCPLDQMCLVIYNLKPVPIVNRIDEMHSYL